MERKGLKRKQLTRRPVRRMRILPSWQSLLGNSLVGSPVQTTARLAVPSDASSGWQSLPDDLM
ncbi:hypothetical protein RchiOBHm_Chr6g0286981 [Rosa chinensis]|uniref:Uncharacterized protein n=1 Tax=Rosa chinensis TaxID=74649 RepID=A0A2P6PUY6_ROSCH|nr:hypothetical protein RchiOBHm_Chr6g0286981 [Rosa chinensis]